MSASHTPEPTSLTHPCKIALIINGNVVIAKKAYHWSIQLLDTVTGRCICKYHVVGSSRNFKYEPDMTYDLQASKSVITNMQLGTLQHAQLAKFHQAIHAVPVDNTDAEWNCQTYIMEVILELQKNDLVGQNTYAECAKLM